MPFTSSPAGPGRLRGREHESDLATSFLLDARDQGRGGTLLITGPAGIGKTVFLSLVVRQARRLGFRVLHSQGDPVTPGASILTALRSGAEPLVTSTAYEGMVRRLDSPGELAGLVAAEIRAAAAARPVLLAMDDGDRPDPVSIAVLRLLAAEPLVLAVAGSALGLEAVPGVLRLPLGPLSPQDVTAVAADRLGLEPDAPGRRLLAVADGNPRSVVRIADSLRTGGAAETAAAIVRHRLSTLDPEGVAVVELAAVAGLLEAASPGLQPGGIASAVASRLLTRDGDTLSVSSEVIQEVVYHGIADARRAELHGRLAQQLLSRTPPAAGAAAHLRAAVRPGDEAGASLIAAAAEMLVPVDVEVAGDLAELGGQALTADHPHWWEIGYRLLSVLVRAERAGSALRLAELLAARTDDPGRSGRVEVKAGQALLLAGRPGEAVERVNRFLGGASPERGVAAALSAVRALGERTSPDPGRATDGDSETVELALRARTAAAEWPATALALCRQARPAGVAAWPEEISALRSLDRQPEAGAMLRAAPAPALVPSLRLARARLDLDAGLLTGAEEHARELVELGARHGPTACTRDAALVLATVALIRGEPSTAARYLQRASPQTAETVALRGWLALLDGDRPAARTAGRELLATGRGWAWPPEWVALVAEIGDRAMTEEAARVAEEGERRTPETATWAGLARFLRGSLDRDVVTLGEGAALLREGPRALLRSWAADGHGRALLVAGERDRAIALLDTAWDEYHRAGARPGRARVQQAMRKAGVRRKKWQAADPRPASGWPSLSEAERRVATLIALGKTNKAAAAELGVSVNTVGTHLRAIYAKLAIQSRVQLTNLLRDQLPLS